MTRDKFMFFPNFKAMADKLDPDMRLKFYDSLTNYVFCGQEPDDPIISALLEAIKPSLDKVDGRQNNGGNHNPNGVNQHTKVGQSGQIRSKLVNSGQFLSETETEAEEETETEEKEISNDIPKKKGFDENTIFQAGGQGWFFPPEIKKLALGKWKEDEIREIEKQFACQEYTSDVCIADLLVRYPPKPSRAKKASVSLGDITIAPEYEYLRPVLENWLGYKKDIKDEYKSSRGLLACIKQLHDYSGGNLQKANKIVERSMANNWKGIFPLQPEKKGETKNLSNYVGESSFLKPTNDDPFLSDL